MQITELSFAERRDWLRLHRTPNVGPVAFRDLLRRYKTAGAALENLPQIIRRKTVSIPPLEDIEGEMDAIERLGIRILAAYEPNYPAYLRAVDPVPPIISV